jgi:hypothetical protein
VQVYVAENDWKDPGSVQVRNIRLLGCVAERIGGERYVGWNIYLEVNAKNSYGGYIGFEGRYILRAINGTTHWDY